MKKPKIVLSKQGPSDLFFRHTEKLFLGLATGLIGLFFWLGLKTPAYNATTPTALLQTSQRAGERMEDADNWSKMADYRKPITDACDRITNTAAFDAGMLDYQHIIGTGFRTLEKRTDPPFLKPGQLHTRYFQALVPLKKKTESDAPVRATPLDLLPESILSYPPNQKAETFCKRAKFKVGQKTRNVDVVVGMALIDYEAQLKAWRETFQYQRNYDANRDVPEYVFVEVQRRTASGDWMPISSRLMETYESLEGNNKDLIRREHTIQNVTMDIPPFAGLDYREFVILPEMDSLRAQDYAPKIEDDARDTHEPVDPVDVFGSDDELSGNEPKTPTAGPNENANDGEKTGRYRLIRFFDLMDKKPGKTYFYRVRLWFRDPNNPANFTTTNTATTTDPKRQGPGGDGNLFDGGDGPDDKGNGGDSRANGASKAPLFIEDVSPVVRQRLLQPVPDVAGLPDKINGVSTRHVLNTIVMGEWVESTVPVKATTSSETFVMGPVDAPTPNRVGSVEFYQNEAEARIVVRSFQNDLGVFVNAETKQLPGSVINFRAVAHVLHPLLWDVRNVFESGVSRNQKTGRYYETDAILVDCMGGQRQPFARRPERFYGPAEIVIMDRNGRLAIHNDMDDETLFRHATFASAENQDLINQTSDQRSNDDRNDDDMPGR